MVLYKRKPAVRRRRKVVRRRPMYMRRPRAISYAKTDVFRRNYVDTISGAGTTAFYGISWALYRLPNYTDFTNLFSQYRISFVKLKISLRNELAGASTNTVPRIFLAKDFTNTTTPASLDELREYSNLKTLKMSYNRPLIFTIRPATTALHGDGTTLVPVWKQWLPTSSPQCDYRGFKIGFDPIPTGQAIDFEWTVYVHCRQPR